MQIGQIPSIKLDQDAIGFFKQKYNESRNVVIKDLDKIKSYNSQLDSSSIKLAKKDTSNSLFSYLPGADYIGSCVGYYAGLVHGQSIENQTIDYLAQRILNDSLGYYGKMAIAEGFKIAASKYVLPFLPGAFGFAGTVVGAGVSSLFSHVLSLASGKSEEELKQIPESEIKKFLEETKEKGLKNHVKALTTHMLIHGFFLQLSQLKNNQDVRNLLKDYVISRKDEDGNKTYVLRDGYVLKEEEVKEYTKLKSQFGKKGLGEISDVGVKKAFKKVIDLISKHTIEEFEMDRDKKITLISPDGVSKILMKCSDGQYCFENGDYVEEGSTLFDLHFENLKVKAVFKRVQDELTKAVESKEDQIEINEFELINVSNSKILKDQSIDRSGLLQSAE